jgi:hypothetical protein
MIRKDVIKDIFVKAFGEHGFRLLECDVATSLKYIPFGEAHVD